MKALRLLPLLLVASCVVVPVPVPLPDGAQRWTLSSDGATLSTRSLSLGCRPDRTLVLIAPELEPVASNEEFSFGTPDEAYLFVAEVAGRSGPGVTARGPIPPRLLDDLAAKASFGATYGPERIGPLSPPAALLDRFVTACRAFL